MLANKKKIKELETVVKNLRGHLEYSQGIVREKCEVIEQLNTEISELKSLIADDMISKVKIENKKGFQLIESWKIPNLSLEQVYDEQDNLNTQGWYTVIHNPNENKLDDFEIIVYGKNE